MSEVPSYLLVQGDAGRIPLPDQSVSLIIGSPPYVDARLYLEDGRNLGIARDARSWIDWMLKVTAEAVRVSRGLVLWVCAGVTRRHCYWPVCEGLLYRWWEQGGQCWRPAFWHRVGIPGSGGKKWLRADVEYVLCFKGKSNDFWTDNTACGEPPKWMPGGAISHRTVDGSRVNRRSLVEAGYGKVIYGDGVRFKGSQNQAYLPPVKANPGNLIRSLVGGGHLGSDLAHDSDAPFPESLVEFFVKSFCPPGGLVLDPFGGSGTVAAVCLKNDRRAISLDLRRSQAELGRRRIADSLRPVSRYDPPRAAKPLDGQMEMFGDEPSESSL
jgi:hypothetical protein